MDHESIVERLHAVLPDADAIRTICKAPSLSLGVLHEGKVVLTKSFGLRDIENNKSANGDTSYLCGSVSKTITSAAMNLLVAGGLVDVSDTVRTHLPGFDPVEDPRIGAGASITDLMRHTSGLANPNPIMFGSNGTMHLDKKQHLAMMNASPTSTGNGQRFSRSVRFYSNGAYGLAAYIIEARTAMNFSAFVKQCIFTPLDMHQTICLDSEYHHNSNIAFPYVQMADGEWFRMASPATTDATPAVIAALGMRSSVNDMLKFATAVMRANDREQANGTVQQNGSGPTGHLLQGIGTMWSRWIARKLNDGFPNDFKHLLGWSSATMPTAALGMGALRQGQWWSAEDKPYLRKIIGAESQPRGVVFHHGTQNGSLAAFHLLPDSHSAVIVFTNAADLVAEMLIQALFDLKPHIDFLPWAADARDRMLKSRAKLIADWHLNRDMTKHTGPPEDYIGTYVGMEVSCINITPSDTAAAGVAVSFHGHLGRACDLEPYHEDSLSFLPLEHDVRLAKGMLDWDHYKVGILEFVRKDGEVVALWWVWDICDYPGLWVRMRDGMGEKERNDVLAEFGRFRKEPVAK